MSRHPYTFAADFIRNLAGIGAEGTKLSRADASQIRQGIAEALGMDDHELACKLSEFYQANSEELGAKTARDMERVLAPATGN